jgi:UDPglucose 6-dehydrogenase
MKISIIGAGYVGMSLFALFVKDYDVMICDINQDKIDAIMTKQSPIKDQNIQDVLDHFEGTIKTTTKRHVAIRHGEVIFICVPTDFDTKLNNFNTERVDHILNQGMSLHPDAIYVIKSTVPVGYTKHIREKWQTDKIVFSPEFLREDKALYDNLYPSRIIVGGIGPIGEKVAEILKKSAVKQNVDVLITTPTEAEAIKLFSNTYLAMRVAFFNELDTFCEVRELSTKEVIKGISLDARIGFGYNNPSFGYGGYCLPKDTKQLLANYDWVPQNLIRAIVKSNETRKEHIAKMIYSKNVKTVGIYRLTMKKESDNIRESAILGIIERLKLLNIDIMIYEPLVKDQFHLGCQMISDLEEFKKISEIIVCNRMEADLEDVVEKIYTRDLFASDT